MSTFATERRIEIDNGLYGHKTGLTDMFRQGRIPAWVKPLTPLQPDNSDTERKPVAQILVESQSGASDATTHTDPIFEVVRESHWSVAHDRRYPPAPDRVVAKCAEYEASDTHADQLDDLPPSGEYVGIGIGVDLGKRGGIESIGLVAEYHHRRSRYDIL